MRSVIRAAVVAVAVVFAVPAMTALAQKAPAVQTTWGVVAMKDVPLKVREAQRRAFPHVKVTKYERSGKGANTLYRFTMSGNHKDATFTATAKLVTK